MRRLPDGDVSRMAFARQLFVEKIPLRSFSGKQMGLTDHDKTENIEEDNI